MDDQTHSAKPRGPEDGLPIFERGSFLALITFVGGYLNAYTYVLRGKIFANNQTGNMAKLGVSLAGGEYDSALAALLMILSCMLGATFSEFIREKGQGRPFPGDWRKLALLIEAAGLLVMAFIPLSVPDTPVNCVFAFLTGYQLCLFRSWRGEAHNTTICTGNLRFTGQLLYKALTHSAWERFISYFFVVFSFVLGAFIGTLLSRCMSTYATLPCVMMLTGAAGWLWASERRAAQTRT